MTFARATRAATPSEVDRVLEAADAINRSAKQPAETGGKINRTILNLLKVARELAKTAGLIVEIRRQVLSQRSKRSKQRQRAAKGQLK